MAGCEFVFDEVESYKVFGLAYVPALEHLGMPPSSSDQYFLDFMSFFVEIWKYSVSNVGAAPWVVGASRRILDPALSCFGFGIGLSSLR